MAGRAKTSLRSETSFESLFRKNIEKLRHVKGSEQMRLDAVRLAFRDSLEASKRNTDADNRAGTRVSLGHAEDRANDRLASAYETEMEAQFRKIARLIGTRNNGQPASLPELRKVSGLIQAVGSRMIKLSGAKPRFSVASAAPRTLNMLSLAGRGVGIAGASVREGAKKNRQIESQSIRTWAEKNRERMERREIERDLQASIGTDARRRQEEDQQEELEGATTPSMFAPPNPFRII